ncbi:MAG: redoxin domain-containing protein, partial [Acidimicrobiales bacterium]|nr:redoxin domain-containing protein [Acidimicrobiales bacterium]
MAPTAPPAAGSVWINTPSHSWEDLRGLPTVLLFWSAGCDASWLLLRRYEDLQRRFGANLQVIAVHCPRVEAAQPVQPVMDQIARMHLSLPVLHDPELETFGRYSPGGWPAAVFIDHRQKVKGVVLGSNSDISEDVANYLGAVPSQEPPLFKVGFRSPRPISEFAWPSGVALLDGSGTVAVADQGHNRVVVGVVDSRSGTLSSTAVIDGVHRPGRLAALNDGLVAVTQPDDGAVCLIDLDLRSVHPLARGMLRPVGIAADRDGSLVVADAGADQLFRIDSAAIADRRLSAPQLIAGSGFTGQNDGKGGRAT